MLVDEKLNKMQLLGQFSVESGFDRPGYVKVNH